MADLEKLNIVIEGTADEATQAIDSLVSKLESMRSVFSEISQFANGFASAFNGVTAGADNVANSVESANETLDGTTKVGEQVTKVVNDVKAAQEDAAKSADEAADALEKENNLFKEAKDVVSRYYNILTKIATAKSDVLEGDDGVFRSQSGKWKALAEAANDAKRRYSELSDLQDELSEIHSQEIEQRDYRADEDYRIRLEKTAEAARKAQEAIRKTAEEAEKQKGKVAKFFESFGRIAKMRLMRWALRQIVTTAKEGLEILIDWDRAFGNNTSEAAKTADELAAKWREVKKAVGAALMPLIQVMQPAITWILNEIIEIFNALNQIIRSAQGFSTYMKATAINTQSATQAAKELRRVLFGFDELNVLNGNGGTGAAGTAVAQDFVVTSIDQEGVWARIGRKINEAYNKLKEYWQIIKPVIEEIWNDVDTRTGKWADWIRETYESLKLGFGKIRVWIIDNIELPLMKAFADFSEWLLTNHPKLAKFLGLSQEKLETVRLRIEALTEMSEETTELFGSDIVKNGERTLTKYKTNIDADTTLSTNTQSLIATGMVSTGGKYAMNYTIHFDTDTYLSPHTLRLEKLVANVSELRDLGWQGLDTLPMPSIGIGRLYASGGDPDMGTLFYAGEAGAEVVATSSSGTGVMNMKQMQDAVSNGNVQVVNTLGAIANIIVRAINEKDVNAYLDGRLITDDVTRRQNARSRATGQPVFVR